MVLKPSQLDDHGFIKDAFDWSEQLATEIADMIGVGPLGENHLRMLSCYRRHYFWSQSVPPANIICQDLGMSETCIDDLFGGALNAWRIAGLPYPGEGARLYTDDQQAFSASVGDDQALVGSSEG